MIGLILSFLLLIIADAAWDWYKITHMQREINHNTDTWAAVAAYIGIGVFFLLRIPIEDILIVFTLLPALRWIMHDFLLNWFRGLPYDYLGSASKLDILGKSYDQFTIKALAFLLSLFISIAIFIITT